MKVASEAALILKSGCGIGYDFSTLRPKGAHVFGAGSGTSGVVSFMKIFDAICSTILSGGARRGAQMGCLDVQHPDILDFITAKRQDGTLRYFNVSVLITDDFMNAVVNDQNWDLWFWEKTTDKVSQDKIKVIKKNDIPFHYSKFNYFSFEDDHVECSSSKRTSSDVFKKVIYKTLPAKELFQLMMKSTYEFADPGFILIDKVNNEDNLWFIEKIRATNPCVTGDTRLHTNLGMRTVKELFDTQSSIRATIDNRAFTSKFGTSVRDVLPVFKTSDKAKVWKVTTKHGYEIKATEYHKFFTNRGKLELKDLVIGDSLQIQSGEGQWGAEGSYDLGLIYGMLLGDGHFTKNESTGECRAVLALWGKDRELKKSLEEKVNNLIKNKAQKNRDYNLSFYDLENKDESRLRSTILANVLKENGVDLENKYNIPNFIWNGSKETITGFMQGLFQSDGHVNCDKNLSKDKSRCSIVLTSIKLDMLKNIQVLLSNFGIVSSINIEHLAKSKLMPDGKGGEKEYDCQTSYRLLVNNIHRDKFMKDIGFLLDYKNNKFFEWREKHPRIINKKDAFTSKIISIDYVGEEAVYDTTEGVNHALIFNGISTGNCGEKPLSPYSNCLLGSLLLCAYVQNPFDKKVSFDFEQYKKDIRTAARLLDNVVEQSNLPLQQLTDNINYQRQHGMGFTGLGSAFNMMNMSYGSKESLDFANKITLLLAQENLLASIEIAKEKGCAPFCKDQQARIDFINSGYNQRLLNSFENKSEIISEILQHGVRWSHATSIAPTGTMSLTWGNNCSNGLEPVFANSYLRNIRLQGKKTKTQEEVMDYAFFLWKEKFGDKKLPEHWRVADQLAIDDHLNIQATIQNWIDSATSKTINVPTEISFDDFKEVYMKGWKLGLKGVTTFRFNPEAHTGVLVQKTDLENTKYMFTLEDGSKVEVKGTDEIYYDGEKHNAANLFDALKEGMYGNM